MVEVGMVMAVMPMVAVFLAVPVLTAEAMGEDRFVNMAMASLLRTTEKAASLVVIQQVEHVLPREENVTHPRDSMGIHDRGRHILVGSDRHEDRTTPNHSRPVLVAQRMTEANGRSQHLLNGETVKRREFQNHDGAEPDTADHGTVLFLIPVEDIAIAETVTALKGHGHSSSTCCRLAETVLLGIPLAQLQPVDMRALKAA